MKNKLKFSRILKRSAFSLIEVLAALAISGITIVAMVKISLESNAQAIKNNIADRATQIASNTIDTLLQLKNSQPLFYCSLNSNPEKWSYFDNSTGTLMLNKASLSASLPKKFMDVPYYDNLFIPPPPSPNLQTFIQDSILSSNTTDNTDGFYRSIRLEPDSVTANKIIHATVMIYWNLYGHDYFYVNQYEFTSSDIC